MVAAVLHPYGCLLAVLMVPLCAPLPTGLGRMPLAVPPLASHHGIGGGVGFPRLLELRGGSEGIPDLDHLMTPEMVRSAGDMMSNMDPETLESVMKMAGDMGGAVDEKSVKEAAAKMRSMTAEEIEEMKEDLKVKRSGLTPPRAAAASRLVENDDQKMEEEEEEEEEEDDGKNLAEAGSLKTEGNNLHTEGLFEAAAKKYCDAKELLAARSEDPAAAALIRSCTLNEVPQTLSTTEAPAAPFVRRRVCPVLSADCSLISRRRWVGSWTGAVLDH